MYLAIMGVIQESLNYNSCVLFLYSFSLFCAITTFFLLLFHSFRSGHYSTKFIGNEYPNGFHGVQLKEHETFEFLALAAALHSARNEELTSVRSTTVCFMFFADLLAVLFEHWFEYMM